MDGAHSTPDDSSDRGLSALGALPPAHQHEQMHVGPLAFSLVGDEVRDIRWHGVELLRGIAFVVRDDQWGTVSSQRLGMERLQRADWLQLRLHSRCTVGAAALRWELQVEATPDDLRLEVIAQAEGASPLFTNRTGFVVLHPAEAAGLPLRVEHTDDRKVQTRFPVAVEPFQPVFDIRCLVHEPCPGLRVQCRLEGDAFEMEDQRNWTDSSFKTYSRPLALPRPYALNPGQSLRQRVVLSVHPKLPSSGPTVTCRAPVVGDPAMPVTLTLGQEAHPLPAIAIAFEPGLLAATMNALPLLRRVRASSLVARCNAVQPLQVLLEEFEASAQAAAALRWPLSMELVVPGRDADAELAVVGSLLSPVLHRYGVSTLTDLVVVPERDLKDRPPDLPAGQAPLRSLVAAARMAAVAWPGCLVGGGSLSHFAELNRHPPPAGLLDLVTHETSAIVHAADDDSVMRTLAALPAVLATARTIAGSARRRIGLAAIGVRSNPYGNDVARSEGHTRVAAVRNDARHHALFGAAFALGHLAQSTDAGVHEWVPALTTGDFGLLGPSPSPQPRSTALLALLEPLSALAGQVAYTVLSSDPSRLLGLAVGSRDAPVLWLANLTPQPLPLAFGALQPHGISLLDTRTLARRGALGWCDGAVGLLPSGSLLVLPAYAVARVQTVGAA